MLDDVSGGYMRPPLVTLVLINWNYAAYVGAAINSILAQDYPAIEVIVVDNGSTDDSRAVIGRHIGGDPRFRIIHLDTNLGQLGAFFHIFDEIRGNFVAILDADDILMSNYVSSHVQVHIALPRSVAFTSSNVYQIDADGRAITGGYGPFGEGLETSARNLPRVETVPRLATLSSRDYRVLAEFDIDHSVHADWMVLGTRHFKHVPPQRAESDTPAAARRQAVPTHGGYLPQHVLSRVGRLGADSFAAFRLPRA